MRGPAVLIVGPYREFRWSFVGSFYILREDGPNWWSTNLLVGIKPESMCDTTILVCVVDRQTADEKCTSMLAYEISSQI